MIAFRTLLLAWLAFSASACGRATTRVAARPVCPSAWRAGWSSDSSIAICLPPGFAAASGALREGHQRWERRPVGQPVGDWLSGSLDTAAAPPPAGRWPPHLASGPACVADCATVDSAVNRAARSFLRGNNVIGSSAKQDASQFDNAV